MKKYLFLISAFITIIGCKNDLDSSANNNAKVSTKKSIPASGEFNHDDMVFTYEYDKSKDKTKVRIKGKSEESYTANGKVLKYFFSDLDADEKDESFIVFTNKKGQSIIKAFSIDTGHPIEIMINEVADAPSNATKTFSGQYGQLIEVMSVNTPDKKVIKKEVRYNLVKGEAGLSLKPQGWTKSQLKSKSGQFKSEIYGNGKYYNKLYVNESETGEWIVDIKVKDNKTDANLCEFHSVGEFINKDLFVPLNYENKNFDGVLQIRFVERAVYIYTQDKEKGSQMAKICNGKGNLSGKYSKLKILYEE